MPSVIAGTSLVKKEFSLHTLLKALPFRRVRGRVFVYELELRAAVLALGRFSPHGAEALPIGP